MLVKLPLTAFKDMFGLKNKAAKENFSVGLDIGTQAVKLVKLRFQQERIELLHFALEPVQLDLGALLKKIILPSDFNALNIALTGPSIIVRYINFPAMEQGELRQALKFEAQKHIPFAVSEVNIDASVLKKGLPDNKMLILLAAVKKDLLSQRLKLIQDAGMRANIVDIDTVALINAYNFNYPPDENAKDKATALLDIGATQSNLNILEDGIPHLSRAIHVAGNNLTQKLIDNLGLDFKSAEEVKSNPDKERLDKVNAAMESVLSNLASEVRISFDYYESQSASSVGKILLSGGGSKSPGLKEMLAGLLGIEVDYWDPLKQIVPAEGVDISKLKNISDRLAVAVGLALRH
jgi:type IV pilus assembly protein PilM